MECTINVDLIQVVDQTAWLDVKKLKCRIALWNQKELCWVSQILSIGYKSRALLSHRHASTTNRFTHLDQNPLKLANGEIEDCLQAVMLERLKVLPY